jgi:hypothetical protein
VDLTIQRDDAKKIFDELYKSKDAIEADMGNIALVWDRKPTTRAGRPIKRRQIFMTDPHDVEDGDLADLQRRRQWAIDLLQRFKNVLTLASGRS